MIHNIVHSILHGLGGVQQYGLVSMSLFCLVFGGVIIRTLFLKKGHLDYMAGVALDEGQPQSLEFHQAHDSRTSQAGAAGKPISAGR